MTRHLFSLAIVLMGVALAAGPAAGQGNDDEAQARKHYEQAVLHEQNSEWDAAIAEYRAAQELFPDPEFHVLIGDAYVKKGDGASALSHYRAYLEEAPDGRAADRVRTAVAELERQFPPKPDEPAEPEPDESTEIDAEPAVQSAAAPDRSDGALEISRPAATRPGRGMRIAGLSTAGAGVALVGVGVYFGLKARSINGELENLGPGDTWDPDRFDEGEAANRNAFIASGIGAAAVVTGGVLYVLGSRGSEAPDAALTVTPSAGPDGAGVLVRGSF